MHIWPSMPSQVTLLQTNEDEPKLIVYLKLLDFLIQRCRGFCTEEEVNPLEDMMADVLINLHEIRKDPDTALVMHDP